MRYIIYLDIIDISSIKSDLLSFIYFIQVVINRDYQMALEYRYCIIIISNTAQNMTTACGFQNQHLLYLGVAD